MENVVWYGPPIVELGCSCLCMCAFTCMRDCQLENSINSLANGATVWTSSCVSGWMTPAYILYTYTHAHTVHQTHVNRVREWISSSFNNTCTYYTCAPYIRFCVRICVDDDDAAFRVCVVWFHCPNIMNLKIISPIHQQHQLANGIFDVNAWPRSREKCASVSGIRKQCSAVNVKHQTTTPGAQSLSSWWSNSHSRNCQRLRSRCRRHSNSSRSWPVNSNSNSNRLDSNSNRTRRI